MNCLLILNLVLSALRKLKRLTGVVVAQGVSSAVTSSKRMAWQWRLTNPKTGTVFLTGLELTT